MNHAPDARQYAPATQRNREPIWTVLSDCLPPTGTILEISSGSGEHSVCFAPRVHPRPWVPSDLNPVARSSIAAWRDHCESDNLLPPIALDTREPVWAVEKEPRPDVLQDLDIARYPITAIVNINMIHITPWEVCLGLMAGAGRILPAGGILYLYGPFKQAGEHTAPSNAAFDQSLRSQNSAWGVRNLEDVVTAAHAQNLSLWKTYEMPANNISVIFRV